VSQLFIDGLSIEGFGVEGPTDPLQSPVMLGVLGIADGLQELGAPPDAAHILGRAGPLAGDVPGVRDPRLRGKHLLHDDPVLPAVAEIVLIEEGGARRSAVFVTTAFRLDYADCAWATAWQAGRFCCVAPSGPVIAAGCLAPTRYGVG
jgi:hypothetical protein